MKTWAAVLLVMLGAGQTVLAQDVGGSLQSQSASSATILSANAASTRAAAGNLAAAGDLGNAEIWNRGESLSVGAALVEPEVAFAAPAPQKIDATETDGLRWQVAFGPSFVRFRSSVFNASAVGTYTSVAWARNEWLSVEGQIVTGFAPVLYPTEHVKYLSYGAGVKVGSQRSQWEPFAHALLGGAHEQPQTAAGGRNSFMIQAGGGVDYRLWPRFSLRGETDYVRTTFFKSSQNNFQFSLAAVFHF